MSGKKETQPGLTDGGSNGGLSKYNPFVILADAEKLGKRYDAPKSFFEALSDCRGRIVRASQERKDALEKH